MRWLIMHTYEDGPKVRRDPKTGVVLNPRKGKSSVTRKDFKRTTHVFSKDVHVDHRSCSGM